MTKTPVAVTVKDTLAGLIAEAEAATARMGAQNPNRSLMLRLCAFSIAISQRCAGLEAEADRWSNRCRSAIESCHERGQEGKEHLYFTPAEVEHFSPPQKRTVGVEADE